MTKRTSSILVSMREKAIYGMAGRLWSLFMQPAWLLAAVLAVERKRSELLEQIWDIQKMSGFGSRLCASLLLVNHSMRLLSIGRNLLVDQHFVLSLALIYCYSERFSRKNFFGEEMNCLNLLDTHVAQDLLLLFASVQALEILWKILDIFE